MSVRAERPLGNVCRCTTPAPSADGRDYLINLVRQIAAEDHEAFAALYQVLSPVLLTIARSRIADPVDAAAVVSATFVEVWRMARYHTRADTDVYAWTTEIVMRRVTDRCPSAAPNRQMVAGDEHAGGVDSGPSWFAAHDQHTSFTLATLLATPPGGTSRLPYSAKAGATVSGVSTVE